MKQIQKIDLVSDWIRQAVAENMVKEPPVSHGFSIVDPFAVGDTTIRRIKAELYKDPQSGAGVVQLGWEGTTPPVLEFEKQYASAKEAETVFSSMLEELRKIESYVDADPAKAKEKVKALFDEYKGKSDKLPSGGSSGRGAGSERSMASSLHQEIAEGWHILNKEGKLVVDFSKEFLTETFKTYKTASSEPVQQGEFIYSTASRIHCGNDNYVISYWRKVQTADGNIIRNAALISRLGGESYFLTKVSLDDYNLICTALTPDPVQYGIAYDSVTGKWYKTAAVVERYFSDPNHPEELDRILDFLGKGKKKPSEEPLDLGKPPKEEKEKEPKEEESLPLGGVEETAPIGGGEEAAKGTPEEQLMDLLKKEASDKK